MRAFMIPAVALALVSSRLAGQVAPAPTGVPHPQAQYVVAWRGPSVSLAVDPAAARAPAPSHLAAVASLLRRVTPTDSFGLEDGASEQVMGGVDDVALGPEGEIFVLDARSGNVRYLGPDGTLRQVIGQAGRGPGELNRPSSIAVNARGQLHVADFQRLLQIFERRANGQFVFVRSFRIPISPVSMCFLGDELIAHGNNFDVNEPLHRIGADGAILGSFGAVYNSPHQMINYSITRGSMACDPASGGIFYHPSMAEIRAFNRDGSARWRVTFEGLATSRVYDDGGGGITVERAPNQMAVAGLAVINGVVTAAVVPVRTESQNAASLILLSATSGLGTVIAYDRGVPRGVAGGRIVTSRNDPFPMVSVLAARR